VIYLDDLPGLLERARPRPLLLVFHPRDTLMVDLVVDALRGEGLPLDVELRPHRHVGPGVVYVLDRRLLDGMPLVTAPPRPRLPDEPAAGPPTLRILDPGWPG
jgi:hypothetical protein